MGLLAYRYRLRVLLAATFAACMIAFPIAGIGGFMVVLNCAYVGGATGIIKRRGRGTPTVIAVDGAAAGFVLGLFIIAALTVLERLRTVTFAAITANVEGTVRFMSLFEPLRPGAEQAKSVFTTALHYWPVLMMVYAMVTIIIVSPDRVVGAVAGAGPAARHSGRAQAGAAGRRRTARTGSGPAHRHPVPLSRRRPRRAAAAEPDHRHRRAHRRHRSQRVGQDHADAAADRTRAHPGSIERPGGIGLGRLGGTAVIMQHPESQVLGTRVADDVVWGLPPGTETDVAGLLDEVGLAGMEERDTGGLSGGELQRLAVAAALARQPPC